MAWFLVFGLLALPAQADAPDLHSSSPQRAPKAKKRKRHARFSGQLAPLAELREAPLEQPSGQIELYAVNFRETLDVNLYDSDGNVSPEALDKLNHFWRCKRTDTEKAIDPELFVTLSRIYDHYRQRIELVSGFRNQKRTSSFHFHGSAADIRIPGVSDKALRDFVATLDTGGMGLGLYPRAGFIHVDIRPEASYRWVDNSPPGTQDMGHPHRGKKRVRVASREN